MNKKEYIVVPVQPRIQKGGTYGDVANQVHQVLMKHVSAGWNYVGMETIGFEIEGGMLEGEQRGSSQMMIFDK